MKAAHILLALLLATLFAALVWAAVELFDIFYLGRQPRPWWWPR